MKKYILFFTICILSLFLVSCQDKEKNTKVNEIDRILTQKYNISDLNNYFEGKNANELVFTGSSQNLHFNDVNQHFPIEVIRPEGYSVYAVDQGGYYYVFWSKLHISNQNLVEDNPFVYFTAYLPSSKEAGAFDSLKAGVSTADDVALIDPSVELTFLMSSGIYSYSFLNKDSVMQIEYTYSGEFKSRSDLIVKNKTVLAREIAPSRFASILLKDLP